MKKSKNTSRNTEKRIKNKKIFSFLFSTENNLAAVILILLAVLPALEIFLRKFFSTGIRASAQYIQHLVLWITFICGMITAREKGHLALSAGVNLIKEPVQSWIKAVTSFLATAITLALAIASLSLSLIGFDPTLKIGIFPIQFMLLVMPVAFFVITVRFITNSPKGRKYRILVWTGIVLGLILGMSPLVNTFRYFITDIFSFGSGFTDLFESIANALLEFSGSVLKILFWPLVIGLIVSAFLGIPIFIMLGGLALFLFLRSGGSIEVIPNEAYTMLTGPAIPAIPLFTLAGFILSESKAGKRLVELFSALFGWLPGGMAIITILVCAFFTTFTGASGVTILALGGLLSYMLIKDGYSKKFSTGLLTASGSIGLLFPPSLPIIMYAVIAQINIKKMFVGGILPGVIMILVLAIMGIRGAKKSKVKKIPFQFSKIKAPLKESIGELLLPVIILVGFFMGITTLVETSAIAVVYVLVLEVFIKKDIKLKDLSGVFFKSVPLIGGVLVILALAKGFSYYIVDAEVPMRLTEWCQAHIQSKYVFLILLNIALLVTGCLMDIFSAIIVVVPLMIPLGVAYGIDPVHLGIIFLTNLQLGYLTPPVGINLFLASYRFETPLIRIYRYVVPFLLLMLIAVLLITYVPWITTWLVSIVNF
ncbi:MAG: TRAP transporter large permease subunit [Spirochaetes bacterium]|nr:TRAP transporter large permease subunit [Spirochaetota bacterium]